MAATQLEFPTQSGLESASARGRYLRFGYRLASDPRYHFSIVLPRGWRVDNAAPVAPSAQQPVQVPAMFVVARGQRSRAEVLVFHLARDIAPVDWLDILLEQRREQVLARREAEAPGGACPDVLSRLAVGRGAYISRWTALKRGPTLFLAHCSTPETEYPQNARDFATAVSEFRLLEPLDWPFAERMHMLRMPIPAGVGVVLPRSWSLRRDDGPNTRAVSYSATSAVGENQLGLLTLAGVTGAAELSAEGLVESYLSELRRNRVGVHQMPLRSTTANLPFTAAWRGRVEGMRQGGQVEVRALVGRCQAGWLLIGMLGPVRAANAWVWAVNRRAFEIAVENVQPAVGEPAA